jgi:hypothetical protein
MALIKFTNPQSAGKREVILMKSQSLKAAITAVVLLAIPGLSLASTQSFQISKAITQEFDTHHIVTGYHYYALMDDGGPYAIVGLEKGYRITGPGWKSVNPKSERFSALVKDLEESPVEGSSTYGAYILDTQNRKIGTWYSSMMAGEFVNQQTKTVSITLHPNWLLN